MMTPAPSLDAPQQVLLIVAALALVIAAESGLWHYRSGFPLRAQWAPVALGVALMASCLMAALWSRQGWVLTMLRGAGWASAIAGIVGVAYHHHYGMAAKAGGYRWWPHWLLYGAPQLAPLALTALGLQAVVGASWLAGRTGVGGLGAREASLLLVALALVGALLQTLALHYRGAFNTRVMYAPFLAPPAAAAGAAWLALGGATTTALVTAIQAACWLTVLTGFVGLGMHLRGIDRQMGGMRVLLFNVLQGPPPFAPAFFSGSAAIGLVAIGSP